MERITGLLFSGFTVKAAGAYFAYYIASTAWEILEPTFSAVSAAL